MNVEKKPTTKTAVCVNKDGTTRNAPVHEFTTHIHFLDPIVKGGKVVGRRKTTYLHDKGNRYTFVETGIEDPLQSRETLSQSMVIK